MVVLEDSDVLHLRHGAWGIFNAKHAENTAVSRALETLDMEVANIMKGGYARPPPQMLHRPCAHDWHLPSWFSSARSADHAVLQQTQKLIIA